MKEHVLKLRQWVAAHPRRSLAIGGALLIVVASITAITAYQLSTPKKIPTPAPVKVSRKPVPKYYSLLTGKQVDSEAALKQPVTGIMIENSPDARPQSGLKDAGVVYEAIAEGGITRFLALYQQEKPGLIGPVRSLRMYYVDWLAPYQASAAHIGGSAAALAEIRNGSYRDIDQFFNAPSYWRANDRAAPHNVYTSFEKLDALNTAKGYTQSEFRSFDRSDMPTTAEASATTIRIDFSSALYNTQYSYDANSKTYARSVGGADHNDREGGRITPSVVIAMHVDMATVMEDGYRGNIATTGSGKAEVFQDGKVIECTWRKNSRGEPLELIDTNGAAIKLIRGQTWIAAVPNGTGGASWE
mgnify:CR=1 FL=1